MYTKDDDSFSTKVRSIKIKSEIPGLIHLALLKNSTSSNRNVLISQSEHELSDGTPSREIRVAETLYNHSIIVCLSRIGDDGKVKSDFFELGAGPEG